MWIVRAGTTREIGGKAAALSALAASGVSIPAWFAIRASSNGDTLGPPSTTLDAELQQAVRELAPDGTRLAVRSSATEEDSMRAFVSPGSTTATCTCRRRTLPRAFTMCGTLHPASASSRIDASAV